MCKANMEQARGHLHRRSEQDLELIGQIRVARSTWSSLEMWLSQLRSGTLRIESIREPQILCAKAWSQWTKQSDVSQQSSKWSPTCSSHPPITMEHSDGQYGTTFQNWSPWTAWRPRLIIGNTQLQFTGARPLIWPCMMWLKG